MTSLVTGVAGLRLAGRRGARSVAARRRRGAGGDRAAARARAARDGRSAIGGWYEQLRREPARTRRALPEPLRRDGGADARLLDAVRHDLRGDDGSASATAVRMIWTGDHLDAARRLQTAIVGPARAASAPASA